MKVIEAKPEHVKDFVMLVERFLDEGIDFYDWGYSLEDAETTYFLWIRNQIALFLEHDGEIIGVLAGQIGPHYFHFKTLVFSEFMFYIVPEQRKLNRSLLLIGKCQDICKRMKVSKFCMGHTMNREPEKFKKFYMRAGFTPLETHYVKDLNYARSCSQ